MKRIAMRPVIAWPRQLAAVALFAAVLPLRAELAEPDHSHRLSVHRGCLRRHAGAAYRREDA